MYEICDIADRSGIPIRTIRYVVDARRVLMMDDKGRVGRGVPRRFDDFVAIPLVIAAHLVESGFKNRTASEVINCLAKAKWLKLPKPDVLGLRLRPPIDAVCSIPGPALLEIGDRRIVRLTLTPKYPGDVPVTTGWVLIELGARVEDEFRPTVCATVDVGKIRDTFRKPS